MTQRIKNLILSLVSASLMLAPFAVPVSVYAAPDINAGLCAGANLSTAPANCATDTAGASEKVDSTIKFVIDIFSLVVGVIAVIMIIVGGLKYITSGGDSGNVTGAKNTILYAIIGLVVVALAQFIVKFVLGKVTA